MCPFPSMHFQSRNILNILDMKIKQYRHLNISNSSTKSLDYYVCKKVSICRIFLVNISDKKKA